MKPRYLLLLLLLLLLLCLPGYSVAQNWSGILDSTRAIDWTHAGIPGGIPSGSWAQCGATLQASTYGNGSSDATSGIQSALNGCTATHYVLLSAGTFRINSGLKIPSNVVLRGAGPSASGTILNFNGSGSGAITFGATSPSSGTVTNITGGATRGSTSITVASTSSIAAGKLMVISQGNLSYMTEAGDNGTCNWCTGDIGGDSGQTVIVTGVAGTTVTISPPLYMDLTNSPQAFPFTVGAQNAGLESLQLRMNNTGYNANIAMNGAYRCWVKAVESNFADGAHALIYYSLQNVVRDSFFHDGYSHTSGGTDDQLDLAYKSSANLVENNIFYRQHVSIMLEWGASGNVIAYNYSNGNYHQDSLTWQLNDIDFHGAHPMFNLFEGNVHTHHQEDSTWGSSSHSTLFREWSTGADQYIPPLNTRSALQTGSAVWTTGNVFGIDLNWLTQFTNLVGDIPGSAHLLSTSPTAWAISPGSGGGGPSCIAIGYDTNANAKSSNNTNATLFVHGVYDCRAGTFQWSGSLTHTLPASFYLSTKPAWWDSSPWPGIGPDVTGGTGPGGFAYANPAMRCFQNGTLDASGYPVFTPSSCYGQQTTGSLVAPPSNLVSIVK
jgi:hypothetical protein